MMSPVLGIVYHLEPVLSVSVSDGKTRLKEAAMAGNHACLDGREASRGRVYKSVNIVD